MAPTPIFVKSPNYTSGRNNYKPIAIVIHIMEGTLSSTDSWFKSTVSQVSAHYGVGINGDVHQYVREEDTAWHAGRVNAPSWALIKQAGTPGKYINPNYYTVGIEHEGDESTVWSDATYKSSSDMIREIATRWSIPIDRDHIVGHHEIYSIKACPGTKVDFNKLISMALGNPVPVVPVITKIVGFGKATTKASVNIRHAPNTTVPIVCAVPPAVQLAFDGFTNNGQDVSGNSKWYYTNEGNWFWSGGVDVAV
ncbi:N-acetylmuramoyl-L-alanine amidase [Mucilaginibacter sp. BJC16-A38]|uniref:N-acetylmuramoyl-L-alanine amidase n=1 Tax=Mucilaginibacter phenanthrenivorans TaxID=1234842 RepID=UPI00215886B0|nr:peptidoglycan recognition family protein [Mucilaginibacter phenanthrenivorans]MCR8559034.1 N-acetylmuramoyl-L-alanine amidase [Mucilaginibacter phenanthrenivorans]